MPEYATPKSNISQNTPPKRKSIRLKNYDYTQSGYYFITICTQNREFLFGDIVNGDMVLNDMGRVIQHCWNDIPAHFPFVQPDAFIIMPNHIHGILVISNVGAQSGTACRAPTEQFGKPISGSIPTIIRSLKSAVTKRINDIRQTPGNTLWQRNYWEHIVRNDDELNNISRYIINNPQNWQDDTLNGGSGNRVMEQIMGSGQPQGPVGGKIKLF